MIKIGNSTDNISVYTCQPKTKEELIEVIRKRIRQEGKECDLNDIDVSEITNISGLFYNLNFNGDISKWNTSNVKNMSCMFAYSAFNGDISRWDISNVKNMSGMFHSSKFNQDISNWNINKNCDTRYMFNDCPIKNEHKPKILQQ